MTDVYLQAYIMEECLGAQEQCLQENTTGTISNIEPGEGMNKEDMTES